MQYDLCAIRVAHCAGTSRLVLLSRELPVGRCARRPRVGALVERATCLPHGNRPGVLAGIVRGGALNCETILSRIYACIEAQPELVTSRLEEAMPRQWRTAAEIVAMTQNSRRSRHLHRRSQELALEENSVSEGDDEGSSVGRSWCGGDVEARMCARCVCGLPPHVKCSICG